MSASPENIIDTLHILHHALGLSPDRREPYRNYYVAGKNNDSMPSLEVLEKSGMMKRVITPAFCNKDDIVFTCTVAGISYAIEHLPPKPIRTKWEKYLRADCFESFSQYLGINKPFFETRGYGRSAKFRMLRRDLSVSWSVFPEVSGDWKPTKKEAKESYKAALKSFGARLKEFVHDE